MASVGSGDGEPEFQIAPIIDVLLVLLIFFVSITSAEVLKVDKELTLPISPNSKERDPEMKQHEFALNARMDPNTKKAILVIDDNVMPDWNAVRERLIARREADPEVRIVIRADAELPASEVEKIMTLVGEAGLADISFAASNR